MSSVAATNPGLSNLLQTLSATSPQLSSILSSSTVQSSLKNASPQDIVKLSEQALELQQVSSLFGSSIGTQSVGLASNSDSLFPSLSSGTAGAASAAILQALESPTTGATTGAASSATASTSTQPSVTDQLAAAFSSMQAQELGSLYGSASATGSLLNTQG
jgi:hypothetical protein